jgi:hypothetical protein
MRMSLGQFVQFRRRTIFKLVFMLCLTPPRMEIGETYLVMARQQLSSVKQADLPIDRIL